LETQTDRAALIGANTPEEHHASSPAASMLHEAVILFFPWLVSKQQQ
jgi:hypothetical protein